MYAVMRIGSAEFSFDHSILCGRLYGNSSLRLTLYNTDFVRKFINKVIEAGFYLWGNMSLSDALTSLRVHYYPAYTLNRFRRELQGDRDMSGKDLIPEYVLNFFPFDNLSSQGDPSYRFDFMVHAVQSGSMPTMEERGHKMCLCFSDIYGNRIPFVVPLPGDSPEFGVHSLQREQAPLCLGVPIMEELAKYILRGKDTSSHAL